MICFDNQKGVNKMIAQEIKKDLDTARKNKQSNVVSFLSTMYADVIAFGKNNGNRETTDAEAIKILKNFQSKTEEVIDLLNKKDPSKVLEYKNKIELLQKYIPKQLSKEELDKIISNYISELPSVDKKSIGVIMNRLKNEHAGTYDGKLASNIIKEKLS